MTGSGDKEKKEVDIFRDTPVRLLGYTNEVGESFRSQMHVKWVWASYVVASAYVVADTIDKSWKAYAKPAKGSATRGTTVTHTAIDTLLWQGLASVIVPGFTINRLCALTQFVMKTGFKSAPPGVMRWAPTVIGLGAIPFIVKPIDHSVDWVLDRTVRPKLSGIRNDSVKS
ncbi:unnamed protein product [Notodromas monacha]|uniref:Mitochondrial fission process protein 1 n=1 Tax=Notodromas monacha TaxID=399045 RepID=A0A7R9BHP8_9CRUS|nr:unnamed protein product [Notodromas monacha]CAG0915673.1 unnamed protein product [Notodromas monacha]